MFSKRRRMPWKLFRTPKEERGLACSLDAEFCYVVFVSASKKS